MGSYSKFAAKTSFAVLFLTGLLSTTALADEIIYSTTTPPPLHEEPTPEPRTGYVWSHGYWAWENGQYVWKAGHWVTVQAHSKWVADSWEQTDDKRWRYTPGHWEQEP